MPTQNTSLKNTTPAGDSNTTNKMVIGKINTYQRTFLIVAGSLLALLVLVAVAGTNGDQHLQSSARKIAEGVVALADYQVDSASNSNGKESRELKQKKNKKAKKAKNKKGDKPTTSNNSDLLFDSENYQKKCCTCSIFCWASGCPLGCPECKNCAPVCCEYNGCTCCSIDDSSCCRTDPDENCIGSF